MLTPGYNKKVLMSWCNYLGTKSWLRTKLIELPKRQAVLEDLLPDKVYELYLVATERNRSTQSAKQIFRTQSNDVGTKSIATGRSRPNFAL